MKLNILAFMAILHNISENYTNRSTGSGTAHIGQIGQLGFFAHKKADSHQIRNFDFYSIN